MGKVGCQKWYFRTKLIVNVAGFRDVCGKSVEN